MVVAVLIDPSASLRVVDSGTSSFYLEQLRVPRGDGLQSSAMGESLPPHLCGLQRTAVPGEAWSCHRTREAPG